MRPDARKLWREMVRSEEKIEEFRQRASDASDELNRMRVKAEAKFRIEIPADAFLLDVLELIDIEEGDVWRWAGVHNNKDLATIRPGRSELSLVRYLAVALGVIAEDSYGILYPSDGDADDVNPWHRTLRPSATPVGGRDHRYPFKETDE